MAQGVREREISMELKTKIMALIEEGWDRNRPPGGVGTTDSATIYTRLLAEGVDVPPGAMARILEAPRIGSLLLMFAASPNDQSEGPLPVDTFATRLSAEALSLRFNP